MADSDKKEVRLKEPPEEVRAKLQSQINEGEKIIKFPVGNEQELKLAREAYSQWHDYNVALITKLFTSDPTCIKSCMRSSPIPMFPTFHDKVRILLNSVDSELNELRSVMRRLELFEEDAKVDMAPLASEIQSVDKKKLFVIHGRNEQLRRAMFDFLRAIGLKPLEWTQALATTEKTSPYIGEIIDAAFRQVQAVVVLLSGDDEARLREEFIQDSDSDYERELMPQPRPNVLFEAGMSMAKYQNRTILVQVGEIRPWSDIGGRHITRLDNTPGKRQEFVQKLRTAGCEIDVSGKDWYEVGNFEETSSA